MLDIENPRRRFFISNYEIHIGAISIDHVIPWSFMCSDNSWNLVYVSKEENSSMQKIITLLIIVLLTQPLLADEQPKLKKGAAYHGKAIKITDGDTLTLLLIKTQYKIRLAQIDTPEKRQPYGNKAKQALSDMVLGKHIKVKIETIDRYGRYVADIYIDGKHINTELVRVGAAWVYKKYVKDKRLFDIEQQAREDKVGLWGLPEADRVPPWKWRKVNR